MTRKTKIVDIDNRRCCKCKKNAKNIIDKEYLCRVHSPARDGFKQQKDEKKW